MITADFIKKIDNARVELSECRTLEDVGEVFAKFEITDYPSKTALLRRCMQIQKMEETADNIASDEAVYKEYLDIFLMGKWRDINLMKESAIPDLGLSDKAVKNRTKKSNDAFNIDEIYDDFNIAEKDYIAFKKFYETNILPRIHKKYLSQLISVVEDMIEDKINKQIKKDKRLRIQKMNQYKIMLAEFGPDLGDKARRSLYLAFSHHAIIFYDSKLDTRTIRVLIARELGRLLALHGIISDKDMEKYANLFAFFAINEENNLSTAGHFTNFYHNETEIIENIKMISSM